jgi:TolB-like protein
VWWLLQTDDASFRDDWTLPDHRSVAVFPFENLGVSPERDYFANGITGSLIADLSKVRGLLVIAPGSVVVDQRREPGSPELPLQLDVEYVVMGGVQRLRDRFRVNVQLVEVRDERAVWGERYDGAIEDVFVIQDKLTAEVIAALEVEMGPGEQESLARQPTASVSAYDEYLRGMQEHGHRTREQNQSAMAHFRGAIATDPTFASAYAGLAMAHSRNAIDGWTDTPSRSLELGLELAQKAAALDRSLPQAHFVVGQVELFRRQHVSAMEAAQRAIQSNPNYADAYALSAWILNYSGRSQDAMDAMQRAMRLNPRPPASYLEVLGEILFSQVRYAESAAVFQRVLEINPNYMRARMWHAVVLALAGETESAEWEAIELLMLNPGFSHANLEFAFPFKDPRVLDTLLDGLLRAGLRM